MAKGTGKKIARLTFLLYANWGTEEQGAEKRVSGKFSVSRAAFSREDHDLLESVRGGGGGGCSFH